MSQVRHAMLAHESVPHLLGELCQSAGVNYNKLLPCPVTWIEQCGSDFGSSVEKKPSVKTRGKRDWNCFYSFQSVYRNACLGDRLTSGGLQDGSFGPWKVKNTVYSDWLREVTKPTCCLSRQKVNFHGGTSMEHFCFFDALGRWKIELWDSNRGRKSMGQSIVINGKEWKPAPDCSKTEVPLLKMNLLPWIHCMK